ncbi:MAG: hypothetical protein MK180_08670 [Rhodobacteraceae bacterium]|nr:hypothetical protein [Paracoccaceae bacterium]
MAMPSGRNRAVRKGIVWGAGLILGGLIAWTLYAPNFVPSDRWVELAIAPSALVGLAIGAGCWWVLGERVKDRPELLDQLPKSTATLLIFALFIVTLLVLSTSRLGVEAVPYLLISDQSSPQQEKARIERYSNSRLGNGWKIAPMVATYQRRIPMANTRIGYCAEEGDQVAMVGTGDWRGMHLERVTVTLTRGEEIVVDYRSDTVTFPERCG